MPIKHETEIARILKKAQSYFDDMKDDRALKECSRILAIYPNHIETLYLKGEILLECERYPEALECFHELLYLDPRKDMAMAALVDVYLAQGEYDKVVDLCSQILAVNPYFWEIYNNLGIAFTKQGKHDAALNAYQNALKIQPDAAVVHFNIGNAKLLTNKYEEALAAYDQAIGIVPDYGDAYNNKIVALRELGRNKEQEEAEKALFKIRMNNLLNIQ